MMVGESVGSRIRSTTGRYEEFSPRPLSLFSYETDYADYINEATDIIYREAWASATPFLNPQATRSVNLVHLAACQGNLWISNRSVDFNAQLLATDEYGRSALHHAAHQGHADLLKRLGVLGANEQTGTKLATHSQLSLADRDGRTALHYAVMGRHVDAVRLLVEAGANVNARDAYNMSPFLFAHFNVDRNKPEQMLQYEEIVDILASANANRIDPVTGEETVLHQAVYLDSRRATERLLACGAELMFKDGVKRATAPMYIAARFGYHETLSILLEHLEPPTINVTDKYGWSPLHHAAALGTLDCLRLLVDKGGDLSKKNPDGNTVIDLLWMFKHEADLVVFATDILDTMVSLVDNADIQAVEIVYKITVDFRMLAPDGQLQMAVVSALIRAMPRKEQIAILQHPVVTTYLYEKWSRVRNLFYSLVFVHFIYVLFLTVYVIVILHAKTDCVFLRRMLFFACIPFCHTLLYFLAEPERYVKRFENWVYLISLTISIGIAVAGEFVPDTLMDTEEPEAEHYRWPPLWILNSISIAILLAWIKMMILAGQFPAWGFYALIFSTVLRNVLKVLFIGIWIIAGFTLSFSVLFHGHYQFENPLKAFVKTVIMFTGEFDYDDLFSTNETNPLSDKSDLYQHRNTLLSITSRLVLLLFVMLASIVLMNLMIGLAVSDIQGLVKEGQFSRLLKQAKFIAHCERLTLKKIFQKWWIPLWLTTIMKSTICTEKILHWHWGDKRQPHVSKELWKDLLQLSLKNRERDKKLGSSMWKTKSKTTTSPRNQYVNNPQTDASSPVGETTKKWSSQNNIV